MSKVVIDPITSGYNLSKINAALQKLATELNTKVLYRSNPVGEPNSLQNDIDMNSNDILNASNINTQSLTLNGSLITPSGLLVTDASSITNTPYGNITSLNVQDAINELDDSKEPADTTILKDADIGTTVQAYDATLDSLSLLGTAADKYAYTTGVDTWAEGSITTAGRALLDDADVTAQRTTLEVTNEITKILVSSSANALTVTLSPDVYEFRSLTLPSGVVTRVPLISSTALTVSTGSTLGIVANVKARIIVLAVLDAGVIYPAVVNQAGGVDLSETGVITTVAEGGAGGADSATVIYSAAAHANCPYRIAGFLDITLVTPGTYDVQPSLVQGAGGNAMTSLQSLGYGEPRQDVSGSRTPGVTYYNESGRPLYVEVGMGSSVGSTITATVGGRSLLGSSYAVAGGTRFIFFIVRIGESYSVTVDAGTPSINSWHEGG